MCGALWRGALTRARRLEELNEQRTSQVARLKLVERDREGLDGAKAEAEAFIEKEAKLLRSRCTLFQLFLGEAQANVAKIEANKAELEAKLVHERCVRCALERASPGR
jgi:structural maintenance of chromosome 4